MYVRWLAVVFFVRENVNTTKIDPLKVTPNLCRVCSVVDLKTAGLTLNPFKVYLGIMAVTGSHREDPDREDLNLRGLRVPSQP